MSTFVVTGAKGGQVHAGGRLLPAHRRPRLRGSAVEGHAEDVSTSRSAWMLFSFHAGRVEEDTAARYIFILYSHIRQICTLTQKDSFK